MFCVAAAVWFKMPDTMLEVSATAGMPALHRTCWYIRDGETDILRSHFPSNASMKRDRNSRKAAWSFGEKTPNTRRSIGSTLSCPV